MPFHEVNGLKYYSFASFDEYGVTNAIFTRRGGVSPKPWKSLNIGGTVGDQDEAVRTNLCRMFDAANRKFSSRYDSWQVHGDILLRIKTPRPEKEPHVKADGLITDQPEVTLLMRFADCVPILLYDPTRNVGGIVHAGWKGTVLQIAKKAVAFLQEQFGCTPSALIAGIGPSIGPDDYEVGEEVVEAVYHSFGKDAFSLMVQKNSSTFFDLWAANKKALQNAGVEQIETAGISTYQHTEDWFSHRKEHGQTGRFGAIFALPGGVD